jgi:dynein heavy chain
MKDLGQNCPENWTLSESSLPMRTCGKKTEKNTCDSLVISTHGQAYQSVRGQIRAFQFGTPDAFMVTSTGPSIDDAYVDGISITHGQSPRKHVFTLAVGVVAYYSAEGDRKMSTCPNTGFGHPQPVFVADKYFCSSGTSKQDIESGMLFSDTPLWTDSYGPGASCDECMCPRTFCVNLPEQTTDDLELRICTDEAVANEDIRIDMIDLWIK